ncbi:hypothetical protein OS493_023148 [Desmophyllum pertusum]|uniref:TAZ-type domain-containing protein n=1 Tax=Desmophyllum pertusum TaxID=174260 RepID=A0A9W9YYF6_9CNID|nr:hypothetical protein OS493_023148 [Desmophyllum pertusum]
MLTSTTAYSQEALISSHATGLVEIIHQPGCSDPNCLLPSCINLKLRRNHIQTCRKKSGRCDICKLLKSDLPDTLIGSPPSQSVRRQKTKSRQTTTQAFPQNEDINIVKVVKAGDKHETKLPESQPRFLSKQMTTYGTVGDHPATREQALGSAVLPHDPTAVNFQHQQQMHLGTTTLQLSTAIQGSNQVMQPPLEVLCNALQALNTVIQLVTSSQLEMHLIPIFRQALAGMEAAVMERLEGKTGPGPLMLNNSPLVLGYFEHDATNNQWTTSMLASPTPLSPPSGASSTTSMTSSPPPAPLSSSSSSSSSPSSSSSSSSSSSMTPLPFFPERSYEYDPGGTNQWAEHIPVQPPYKTMFQSNPVFGDMRSESDFDQDIILLDFVEELLG